MLQPRRIFFNSPAILLVSFLLIECECGLVLNLKSQKLSSSTLPSVEVYEVKRQNVELVRYTSGSHNRGQRSSSMQLINVTRNSDLFFGEVTAQDSALLLQCEAPYSVQWIYRGDGDPEFNTNTTTTMEYSTGSRMYNAYLFLGSRRNLNERETGKYICTSVRNKRLFSFVYIYVKDHSSGEFNPPPDHHEPSKFEPGHFTTPGPISSPSTPPSPGNCLRTKITCGLHAICYVSHTGPERCKCIEGYGGNPYVECRPKSEITTPHPPPPNNDPDGGLSCTSYDDCPFDQACYQRNCQDPCKVRPICGPHTTCTTQHHTPFCECEEGYEGDPYSSQEGQRCEAIHVHCSPNPCGPNTICKYVNGIISCSCESGFSTHNDGLCRPDQKNELNISPNVTTTTTSTTTITTVKPAQIIQVQGQPKNPLPPPFRNRTTIPSRITTSTTTTTTARPSPPTQFILPPRHTAINVVATPSSPGKECHYDVDCPDDKMCIQDKCENPCVNACGSGAKCTTKNHFPRCICPEGTTGDPFYKCSPLFSGVLGSSSSGSHHAPSNLENDGESSGRYHANCGGRYSPCGPNSVCQATKNRFVCACPSFTVGDPYSSRGCYSESGYQKCQRDEDCPHFLTCLRYKGCVNPCDVLNVCQPGRSCVPHLHRPACLKTANFDIDVPRDELVPEEAKDELEISEVPNEMSKSRCFIKSEGKILSPCGRNSICYDNKNGTEPSCGCMANHVGDPFIECDPLKSCKKNVECGPSETCLGGFCRLGFGGNPSNTNASSSTGNRISLRNPCSPSPCKSPEERCAIVRETNSAACVAPGKSLEEEEELTAAGYRNPNRYLSRSDLCVLTGSCEESADDNEEDNLNTTELASDFIVISSSTGPSSSSSSSSMEENRSTPSHSIDFSFSYSNETARVSRENTVMDA